MPTIAASSRLALGQATLTQLRQVLERELPANAPSLLREIGFAAGESLYDSFVESVADRFGVEAPQALDVRYLGEALAGFFRDQGWGSVTAELLARGIFLLDSADWTEAERRNSEFPSCHFSAGMLSDFFSRLAGYPAAVMEVECRTQAQPKCRFLIGSPDLLTWIFEQLTEGRPMEHLVADLRTNR